MPPLVLRSDRLAGILSDFGIPVISDALQMEESGQEITHLTHTGHHLVSGGARGLIAMRDHRTLQTSHTILSSPGGFIGFEGSGHQLYSFGCTLRCVHRWQLSPSSILYLNSAIADKEDRSLIQFSTSGTSELCDL